MSDDEGEWLPVIARSLAYLCMRYQAGDDKGIARSADFLEGLGLKRADVAKMLGTTPASITEMLRLGRKKKGGRRGTPKKKKARR